jgi:hypothetical protein
MAQRIVTTLVDDIDGTELDLGEGETVLFSIDGRSYEIDLSDENVTELRRSLEPFVSVARKIKPARRRRRR